jgi:hypothetical protein
VTAPGAAGSYRQGNDVRAQVDSVISDALSSLGG